MAAAEQKLESIARQAAESLEKILKAAKEQKLEKATQQAVISINKINGALSKLGKI